MYKDTKLMVVADTEEREEFVHPSTIQILDYIAQTSIPQERAENYTNPEKTPPQSLQKTIDGSLRLLTDYANQTYNDTKAHSMFPQAFNFSGPVFGLGITTLYLLGAASGELSKENSVYPFNDTEWDMSQEETSKLVREIEEVMEEVEVFIGDDSPAVAVDGRLLRNPENSKAIFMAASYLKVKELFIPHRN